MNVSLRKATEEDARLLYEWRNDPLVRQNSFHTEEIAYADHLQWFARMLQDPDSRQFILVVGEEPAGQVRLHRVSSEGEAGEAAVWEISYSIARAFRGQGLGRQMLRLVEHEARTGAKNSRNPIEKGDRNKSGENGQQEQRRTLCQVMLARVKPENLASLRIFRELGYAETGACPQFVEFRKELR